MADSPLTITDSGLYCEAGDFYIDPWRPVERALITHSHSDHARQGMGQYLTAAPSEQLLRARVGADAGHLDRALRRDRSNKRRLNLFSPSGPYSRIIANSN